ncbi:MAG: TolC family protein [Gemmatimonadaceae bacterium]|jgi:outer membrane protein TolC|nr:TolC family protein [Gemmatimonadaceae bacterium]
MIASPQPGGRERPFRHARACLSTVLVCALAAPALLRAQSRPDTIHLGDLYPLAEAHDPRAAQLPLLRQQANARRETIRRELLPALSVNGSAQYLSDVASVGTLPGIGPVGPLNHQYDAYLTIREPIVDFSRPARDRVERERLTEAEAGVRATLYGQRAAVNEAYFAVLQRRTQQRVLEAAIADLSARRNAAQLRVTSGAALASEALVIDAELVRRRQALADAASEERIALQQLSQLIGRPISPEIPLAVPQPAESRIAADTARPLARQRPEYTQFDRSRAVLEARESAVGGMDRPRLALVTRTGYGRPGLNALGREFDSYISTGLQLEWTPWNWGASRRSREELRASANIIRTNEAAFTRAVERASLADRQRLDALQRLLATDDDVVALRERILAEARLRHDEGEMAAADYVTRANDLLIAQLDRETRRIRIAEVHIRYLTTIGQELR